MCHVPRNTAHLNVRNCKTVQVLVTTQCAETTVGTLVNCPHDTALSFHRLILYTSNFIVTFIYYYWYQHYRYP